MLPGRAACLGAGLTTEQRALALGWAALQAAELSLIVVELSTNSVRHAKAGVCTLTLSPEYCDLEVRDAGPGYPAWVLESHAANAPIELARPTQARAAGLGAGLDVVRRLSTKLWLSNDPLTGAARVVVHISRRRA
jgi:anti-sigma regulatory factor (Ser/Thr protein kinase)